MEFPESSTQKELSLTWLRIAEISDKDFGFTDLEKKTDKIRFSVRVLLYNDKGEICVVKSEKYGYFQLPGGGVEKGESIIEAAIRETKEETGLNIHSLKCSGEVLFVNDDYQEMMYVYEIEDFDGDEITCDEGDLKWIPIKEIYNYPMWEGDKEFLPLLINHAPYFKMSLIYKNKDLVQVIK